MYCIVARPLSKHACAAGIITGDIRVGGFPRVQHTFARVMGYVEQSDIHSPMVRLTVQSETLPMRGCLSSCDCSCGPCCVDVRAPMQQCCVVVLTPTCVSPDVFHT